MRKILIDVGANQGYVSDLMFSKISNFDFEIFSFEPNPKFEKDLSKKPYHINHIKSAAWTIDGELQFRFDESPQSYGSSCILSKRTGSLSKPTSVPCVDLSSWIKRTFTPSDYIILKIDIEGAEYEVVPKLFEEKALDIVSVFLLDLHSNNKINVEKSIWNQYTSNMSLVLNGLSPSCLLIKNPDWHNESLYKVLIDHIEKNVNNESVHQ